jgi:uncharacterized protein (DUF2384 family)
MTTVAEAQNTQSINHGAAFKMGNNILDKWECSAAQKQAILGIPRSSFHRYQKDPSTVSLSSDQLERLSYIANIHQALRIVFSNPDNVYGFMGMINQNPYFNGKSPLSIISTGNFGALYEVSKRIDSMRSGQW